MGSIRRKALDALREHFQLRVEDTPTEMSGAVIPVAAIATCLESAPIFGDVQIVGAGTISLFMPLLASGPLEPGTYDVQFALSWNASVADLLLVRFEIDTVAGVVVTRLAYFEVNTAGDLAGRFVRSYQVRIDRDQHFRILANAQAATTRTVSSIVAQRR